MPSILLFLGLPTAVTGGSSHSIQDHAAPNPSQSLVHNKHDHFSSEFFAMRNATSNPITVTSAIKQLTLMMISE